MAEDLVELGIEGFDMLVDRYHDTAHDHVVQYGRKLPMPKRWRKNTPGTEQAPEQLQPQRQRASSETRVEPSEEPRRYRGNRDIEFSEDEDQGYASERPRRRSRRYSGNESRGENAAYAHQRRVRINLFHEMSFARP
jgi:hypothetical protein